MPAQFDATARINVDLRGFSRAANEVTRSGGTMTNIFRNMHTQLNQLEVVEKKQAAAIRATAGAYNAVISVARNYAAAMATLAKNETSAADGAQKMAAVFGQLRNALSGVQGLSQKESDRLNRTVGLYLQLATVLKKVADSYRAIAAVRQGDTKGDQAMQRQAQAAQRLALEQQKVEISAQRAANAQQRLNAELKSGETSMRGFGQSTFAMRSSLGEIEQMGRQLIQVFSAMGKALIGSAISQESAFAQVSRVVGKVNADAVDLIGSFREIAETFPISFEEVARIGQLGAQIGIAADELDGFTRTVAKFSLTTGVSVDQTTLLLGRIAEMQDVPVSEMENLGSAILALGTASAATDEEILRVNESIATVSNVFGLSAQAVSGLAAALATVRVRPELSRGSLTRVFGQLDKAISGGDEALLQLATTMGMTAQEVVKLRRSNPDEFFLAFVKGLKNSAGSGKDFQKVLKDLGIKAVRDIDTFTRLGNNFDVVTESFARSNAEWLKGTELQRQAQGIFETTSSKLQNLGDAFKSMLAIAGTPLAGAIGLLASGLQKVVDGLTNLGPFVPIMGTLTAAVIAGGLAWATYQVIVAKSIQSMLATRELQRSLGVQTLGLGTALGVYRKELGTTAGASANLANSLRLANSQMTVGQAAAAKSAASITAMGVASDRTSAATVRQVAANRSLGLSIAASSTATRQAAANTALMGTAAAEAVRANQLLAGSTFASARAIQASGAAAAVATRQVALYGATSRAMVTSLNTTASAGLAGAAGLTALGRGAQAASLGARAAAFAFGPWGIAIGVLALALGPLIGEMFKFETGAEKLAASAMEASGGTTALANAIKADTQVFRETGSAYRTFTSDLKNVADSSYKAGKATIAKAEADKRSITLTAGSRAELERQAQGYGKGASAARLYLAELNKQDKVINATTKALKQSTTAIGENTQKWLLSTAEAAASSSKIADGSDLSRKSLEQLSLVGVDVGEVLTKAMTDPQGASKDLEAAISEIGKTADNYAVGGSKFADSINTEAAAAIRLKEFLEALKITVDATSDEALKASAVNTILGKSLTEAAKGADVMRGGVKITTEGLEELDITTEEANKSIDGFVKNLMEFGGPLDAFGKAAVRSFAGLKDGPKTAEDAIAKFSLNSRTNLNLFLEELDKIAVAQRNWAANLVKISATLGTDIAQGLADLGPKAAPLLQQLSELTVGELAKLKPRLAALGMGSIEALAAGILKGQTQLTNVSAKTGQLIATQLSAALGSAKNTQEFLAIIDKYGKLVETIKNHKGEINIDNVKALKSLDDIIKYIEISQDKRLFDPKGRADLKTELFQRGALELLSFIIRLEKEGAFDPKGKAKMDKSAFTSDVGSIRDLVYRGERNGWFNPDGKANLNQGPFNNGIAQVRATARSTANYISNTMSTSATVRVGYFYYEKNNRPSTAYVKDGGWINGPGGPRDDKVPAMLSNGEFVVSAAQARQHGALLEAINSGRAGKGYSTGIKKMSNVRIQDMKPVQLTSADMGKAMERALIQRLPSMSALTRQIPLTNNRNGSVFNITNQYPQAEPTSVTINRSLAYAATISGVS